MKKICTLCTMLLLLVVTAQAQEKKQNTESNQLINTLKERIRLTGYVQTDYTYTDKNSEGKAENTFDIKRAILWGDARITDQWSARLMFNCGGTGSTNKATSCKILEAWTEYAFLPELKVTVGQFKTPFTIENPFSPTTLETVDCNAQMVSYMLGGLIGNHGGRDMGLMVHGNLFNKKLSYNLALMQGQGLNIKDGNNQKEFVAKLTAKPLDWLQVSGSVSTGTGYAVTTSAYNPTVAAGDNFKRDRLAIGALLTFKPLTLRTEYLYGKDSDVKMDGFYATTTIHVLPKFDVIASCDYANFNHDADAKQTNLIAGVQYWFYPRCRLQAQYSHRNPDHREAYNMIQCQLQVAF